MFLLGWSNTSFDPDGSTYQLFYSGNHGATGNRAFFSNDKVDELIPFCTAESEESKRMELYKELQFVLHEESLRGVRYTTKRITLVCAQT